MLTEIELNREAAFTGFRTEVLEKVIHLLSLLDTLRLHPFLKKRVGLKGGTALNLFVFDVPRLSVDIHLNYIGAADRETARSDHAGGGGTTQALSDHHLARSRHTRRCGHLE